jgi:activator of HSP90 ATPase
MLAFGGLGARTAAAAGATDDGVIHGAEAIHQEPLISASPLRVYAALTDAKQFDKLTQWSAALQAMAIKRTPAAISPHPGGPFALFGGYITGRFIELIPRELIVQAWRAGSWGPGVYSIARFELSAQGAATKIVFDHSGFPAGQGEHLAEGWHGNYWEPLEKLLAPPRT